MFDRDFLIGFVNLAVGAAALAIYMRRDRGVVPEDRLPDALGEPLDGRQWSEREGAR